MIHPPKIEKYVFFDPNEYHFVQSVLPRTQMTEIFMKYFPMKTDLDYTGKLSEIDYFDILEQKMICKQTTKNFAFLHDNQTCYILNKNTGVQITWYKLGHIGHYNTVSKDKQSIAFTLADFEQYCSQIRQDLDLELKKQFSK